MTAAPAPCPACGGRRTLRSGLPYCPRECATGLRLPERAGEWDSASGAGSRMRRPLYEDFDRSSVDDQDLYARLFDNYEAVEDD